MRDTVSLPKAQVHVRLTDSIRPRTLRELATANGLSVPPGYLDPPPADAVVDRRHFIHSCLRTASDFRRVASELVEDHAAQGVGWVEVRFDAVAHGERLQAPTMPLDAVLEGLADGLVPAGVILEHARQKSLDRAWRLFDLATSHRRRGVVAIGLTGDERVPFDAYAELFRVARSEALHVVHDAGRRGPPSMVRDAVLVGSAERVGHGLQAIRDPHVVELLRERAIPLEVCPSANVLSGVATSLEDHPVRAMLDAGLVVAIATGRGSALADELAAVRDALDLDDRAVAGLAQTTLDASFAPEALKRSLTSMIERWLAAEVA